MSPVTFKPAWRLGDRTIEQDALAFWKRLDLLPPQVDPDARVRELVAAVYDGEDLVALATASISPLQTLRERFALYRASVDPARRGAGLVVELTVYCRRLLEEWSRDHPDEGVMGMAMIIAGYQSRRNQLPYWPEIDALLADHTPEGDQIRLTWFAHARVE